MSAGLVIGFLLGIAMAHFVFAAASRTFGSPCGQHTPPQAILPWRLAEFVSLAARGARKARRRRALASDLLGLPSGRWAGVATIGRFIRRFLPAGLPAWRDPDPE